MKALFVLTAALTMLLLCGCGNSKPVPFEKLSVFHGGEQCALPGEDFPKPLYILVSGKASNSIFSSGELPPAGGQKVRFEPAEGSDLILSAKNAVSDPGGLVSVSVKAGKKTGDQYLKVIPESAPDKVLLVRFISGIRISGALQEIRSGKKSESPLTVKAVNPDGTPSVGVPVYFNVSRTPEKGGNIELVSNTVVTNQNGEASTSIIMGGATGEYDVNIEVAGRTSNLTRGIVVKELGINFLSLIMNVLGGVCIFVFGMKLMSDGLSKAAGDKMRSILHLFSSNRYVAVVAGILVTAVIQSSSATTVMVVGFVNAGLLNLVQSIGIIFGANIGTTVTAQIIAFDVSTVTMPAIIIGLLLVFVSWKYVRGWGETILGFGLLFFGMVLMSSELEHIANFPTFVQFFSSFNCAPDGGWIPIGPLLGTIGIGLVVTMIIQSSSAATGIVLALGASGLINLYTAVALVLGSNIGTTITAQLAAIPANRIAKQTALAHTLFNVTGVLLIASTFYIRWGDSGVPVFFYIIDRITAGDAFAAIPQNVPRHIANAHTLFNVFTTLLLLPFLGGFAKICEKILPIRKEEIKYTCLEPRLLDTPEIALAQTASTYHGMFRESWSMISEAMEKHFMKNNIDEAVIETFAKREKNIDKLQYEITSYLTQLTRHPLSQEQAEFVPVLMHCTNDAERIADHTEVILGLAKRLGETGKTISQAGVDDLNSLYELLKIQAGEVITSLEQHDPERAKRAKKMEKEIIALSAECENHHIERLNGGKCNAEAGIIMIELLGEIEKVSGKLSNIAARATAVQKYYQSISSTKNASQMSPVSAI